MAHILQKWGRFFLEMEYKNGYTDSFSYSSLTNFLKSCQYMKKAIILNELSKFQNTLQNLYPVGTSPLYILYLIICIIQFVFKPWKKKKYIKPVDLWLFMAQEGMGMEMGKGQKTHIQHIIKQIAQYTIINSSACTC